MADKPMESRRLDWQMFLYATLAAIAVFIPLLISENIDFLYLFFIMPGLIILGLSALIYAAFRKNLRTAAMVATFWLVSAFLFLHSSDVRAPFKWLLFSRQYKQRVLARSDPPDGDFKHVEWDGWGWAGIDTTVYLVFDPADSLAAAAKSEDSGKFNGIPCEVPWVHRMASQWYTVMFYTDKNWDGCDEEAKKTHSPGQPVSIH
jgi:hypothetical protein